MKNEFMLKRKDWYPSAFITSSAIILASTTFCNFINENALTMIGMLGAFFAFLYTQHLQQTQFFKELFTGFNQRYDNMNEELARIAVTSKPPEGRDKSILIDYFNLCSEEYLFYKSGYIEERVWIAWRKGMQHYLENKLIFHAWSNELASGSYYGLTIEEIKKS